MPSSAISVQAARIAPWYCGGTWSRTDAASAHDCEPTLRVDPLAPSDGRHSSAKDPNTTYVPCGSVAGIGMP